MLAEKGSVMAWEGSVTVYAVTHRHRWGADAWLAWTEECAEELKRMHFDSEREESWHVEERTLKPFDTLHFPID